MDNQDDGMEELDLIAYIFTYVNLASLLFSLLLACFIGLTQILKLRSARRLSFRLYLWIGLSDILTHLPLHLDFVQDLTSCRVTNLIVSFSNFVSLLIVAVMALNLHLVFLLQKPTAVQSLPRYLMGVTVMAMFLMIPSITLTFIHETACPFFTALPVPDAIWVLYATQGVPQLMLIVYCLYVFFATTIKLRVTLHKYLGLPKPNRDSATSALSLREQHRMVGRLALYPLMPLITIVPYFVVLALHPTVDMHLPFSQTVQWFAASTQGTLNALFFLIDPSLPAIFHELYRKFTAFYRSLLPSTAPSQFESPLSPTKFIPTNVLLTHHHDYDHPAAEIGAVCSYPYLSENHRALL